MKKLFALLAVVLAVVSCQKDADLGVNVGGEQLVNITVALPEATRANSGAGFDLATLGTDFELRYILEIYVEGSNTEKCIRKEAYTNVTSNVVFPVRLVPGRDYRIVAWADIVPTITGERTAEGDYDYYYETSKGLDEVTIVENDEITWNAMDEYRDAYTAYDVVYGFSANRSLDLILTRPFAKVRVVSTDIKDIEDLGFELGHGKVEYRYAMYRKFNAYTGIAFDAKPKTHEEFSYPTPYTGDYENETQRTLFADYILVNNVKNPDVVQFTMNVWDSNDVLIKETQFMTDIPVHANKLTTIIGEVLTEGGNVKVTINNGLEEQECVTVVSSASHLLNVLNSGKEYILGNNIVVTTADLNEFKPIITRGNNETKTTIINLNGYTVTIQNDGTGEPVVLESGNTLIFAGEGAIKGNGALVDNKNANVVVTGGATVANGTTTEAVLTGVKALEYIVANGGEFTFTADIEVTSKKILSITADNVVINGNGFAFTSNAPRAINVDGADGVVIKNLNIVASGERAINLINGGTNVTVENVTAKAANYTFNVAGSSAGAVAIIKNSDLTGLNTVNIAAENTNVTITNTKLTTVDNTEVEHYATIAVNKYAEGSKVAVNGGEVVITGTHCDGCNVASVGSDNSEVTFDGTVGATNDDVVIIYFATIYSDGTYYGHATLDEAIAQSEKDNGSVITLIRNYTTSEPLIIANDKSVTLDLNGKTITGYDESTGSFGLITNKGNLTITGNGKITLVAKNNRGWNAYSSVISNNPGGNLVVENVTIEHLGGTDMAYGIDNLTNGKGTSAVANINDGAVVKSCYRAIRQFLNGVEATNELYVNPGAVVEGANKSIWMQDPSTNANTGKLTVTEGATLNGDVYLFVTAGSTEWPVEVSIAASAVNGEVLTGNVPEGYAVENINGVWVVNAYTSVASATEIQEALANGENVILSGDIAVTKSEADSNSYGAAGINTNGGIIDGNGKNFSADVWTTWDSAISATNGTIKNLNITGGFRGIFMPGADADVYIDNVTFNNVVYTFNSDGGNKNYGVYISNSILNGWTSFSDVHKEVVFTNCKFGKGSGNAFCRPYNPCVFENCEFSTDMEFDTTKQQNIVFKNCTYGGVKITAENAATFTAFFYNGVGSVSFE